MADTLFYLAPNSTAGSEDGSTSNPWTSINASAWTAINSALATGDVYVFGTARKAASDVNEVMTVAISLQRNATAFRLYFIGNEKYNTSDASPTWVPYVGSSIFQTAPAAGAPLLAAVGNRNDNLTIRGIHTLAVTGQGFFLYAGSNVVVEDCTMENGSFLLHQSILNGDGPSLNLILRRNTIFDSNTSRHHEGIYISGFTNKDPEGQSYAHSGILIEDNTIYDIASDAIDIKDGMDDVTIRGNTSYQGVLYDFAGADGTGGIVTESAALIEKNFIYHTRQGIKCSTFWNDNLGFRSGTIIKNNIIIEVNTGLNINADVNGLDQFDGIKMQNNTITHSRNANGIAIEQYLTGAEIHNNILFECLGPSINTVGSSLGAHSNNLIYQSAGGTLWSNNGVAYTAANIANLESTAVTSDPLLVDTTDKEGPATNWKLTVSSPALDVGATVTGLTEDHFGTARPQNTINDIGAHEFSGSAPAPTFSSSEIGLQATTKIIATFSKNINSPGADYTLGFTVNIGSISSALRGTNQATIEFTLSDAITETQSLTLAYSSASGDIESQDTTPIALATFSATAVTNNINDATPTYSSGIVLPAADTLLLTFSENLISPSDAYETGFTMEVDSVGAAISSVTLEPTATQLRVLFAPIVSESNVVTISYNDTLGDIKDTHATVPLALATFVNQAITNNVPATSSAIVLSARLRLQP